jgi:hypothetical protein
MGLEDDAKAAARVLLEGRLAAAPPYLLPMEWQRALSPADVRQRAVTKMDWQQAAQIHLLAAEHALERPSPTVRGKPWSSRFVHCMVLHLTNSAKDGEITDRQQVTLLLAAHDLQYVANPPAARGLKNRLQQAGIDESDLDWFVALGNSRTQFQQAVDSLNSFHKFESSRPPVVQLPRLDPPAIAVSVPGQSGPGGDPESIRVSVATAVTAGGNSQLRKDDRPSWLALGPAGGTAAPDAGPAWRMPDSAPALSRGELDQALLSAWDSFSHDDIAAADETLRPVYSSMFQSWAPIASPDGQILWAWLRFVRVAAAANDSEYASRRLAAVSAVELLAGTDFNVADREGLLEDLVEAALSGLPPVPGQPLSRAFASYSGRIIAATGHEQLFGLLGYSNQERASARAVWAQEFPSLQLSARDSSADVAAALKKAYREFRYRAAQQIENYAFSEQFLAVINSSVELVDTAERSLLNEAIPLLTETVTQAKSTARIDVPAVRELDSALQNLSQDVCASGSLLLQETLYPAILGARTVLASKLGVASRVSHPELRAQLVSVKLPLTARTSSPFKVRFLVRNEGNSVAREVWAQASAEGLELGPVAQPADLPPAAEQELSFEATCDSPSQTVTVTLRLTWCDDLGQEFAATAQHLAEDQRPSLWTTTDANPYTLSSISDPSRLIGRSAELASLEGVLRMSDSTYITGLKRVGKSSLVRTLLGTLRGQPGWAISELDLGTMLGSSASPASIALGIIDGIGEALADSGVAALPIDLSESAGDYARHAGKWIRSLERSTPELKSLHVVVAIDDFDGIPMEFVDGESGRGLFLFLRSLVDKPWLSLVFIGSENLPTVIAGQGFQLNQVRRTPLDHFSSKEDTARLLRSPAGDRLDWSEDSIELIHQMANGNPYYATMIAQRLWDSLRNLDRTLVESTDVADAVSYVANNQDAFRFSHMWGDDSTGMVPKSRRAMLSAAVLLSAARCAPTTRSSARADEILSVAQGIAGEATLDELKAILQRLLSRQILTSRGTSDNVAVRVPLLAEWLRARGRRDLEAEFEQFTRVGGAKRAITASDLVELAQGLNYAGSAVNALQLEAWIHQFGEDPRDRHLAFLLLRRLIKEGYFTHSRMYRTILPKLADQIREKVPELRTAKQNYIENAIIVSHGVLGSSAPMSATSLRQILRVKKENCTTIEGVRDRMAHIKDPVLILVDDFAGTGNQLAKSVGALCAELDQFDDWQDATVIVAGAAVAADTSKWSPDPYRGADVRAVVGYPVPDRLRAFTDSADIFESEDDRERARDLVTVIGKSITPDHPLGWAGQGLLVLLETNCPNNTLPVFWKEGRFRGRTWRPLFQRAT